MLFTTRGRSRAPHPLHARSDMVACCSLPRPKKVCACQNTAQAHRGKRTAHAPPLFRLVVSVAHAALGVDSSLHLSKLGPQHLAVLTAVRRSSSSHGTRHTHTLAGPQGCDGFTSEKILSLTLSNCTATHSLLRLQVAAPAPAPVLVVSSCPLPDSAHSHLSKR
jgi:hypothetical protein